MIDLIPVELRELPQWVIAGADKEPRNPRTGNRADVTNPATWGTYQEAKQAGAIHIGFVLAASDPYTIIDLDNPFERAKTKTIITEADPDWDEACARAARHKHILTAFSSYAELSQSGNGVHIIVRGSIPQGVRRDKVEVYSTQRYMICTGKAINNFPICNHQELLNTIYSEMGSTVSSALDEIEQTTSDDRILEMAIGAANSTKFNALCNGQLNGYPSQSEADFALLTIYCFYSKSNAQVRRLFRASALGQRDKAQRNDDYINRALEKIRARQSVPLVDISALLTIPPKAPVTVTEEPPVNYLVETPPQHNLVFPPGLVGGVADYVWSSAIRPVPEVGLMAALALVGGITGRSYNISSTGLNQYLMLLAKTGTGKEGAAGGIDALISAVRPMIPMADDFVGPGTFASGQALIRVLDKSPCFVSVLGEFGLTLQQICDKNAGSHNVQLRKVLLDLFAKSGFNKTMRPSVYSDSEKNTLSVRAPNVTILGESTPESFYGALDGSHIAEGLVPRFMIVEYTGDRPPKNMNAFHAPNGSLVNGLRSAVEIACQTRQNDTCCPVQTDRHALVVLDAFDIMADEKINSAGNQDVEAQLWNRAHIKALKLAALVAVGCNLHQPVITKEVAEWAVGMVERDVLNMAKKFSSGEVGHGDHQQENDIRNAIERYVTLTPKQREGYKVPRLLREQGYLIPHVFLKRFCALRASFKNDRRGAVVALQVALQDMLKAGCLKQLPEQQARTELGIDSPVYVKGEAW